MEERDREDSLEFRNRIIGKEIPSTFEPKGKIQCSFFLALERAFVRIFQEIGRGGGIVVVTIGRGARATIETCLEWLHR